MLISYFNLLTFLYICSSYAIKTDGTWPWRKTKYLTRSNWTSELLPSDDHPSVWFIFHYLNYCGYCKKAEPGWEAVAQYTINWSKYIQIGAYDCASESFSRNDICQDEKYPQWRIYCPLTNSTQLAFKSERRSVATKPEEILIWALEKLNTIAQQCYGTSWPVRDVIESKTKEDLDKIIPKDINNFQLFVSDDVALYTLYVLNNSKTVDKEPIYRLPKQNEITNDTGIWKGNRNENGEIFLESVDSPEAMNPFLLNKNIISRLQTTEGKNTAASKPTLSDIDSAFVWMLSKDLRRKLPRLTADVKIWINVLYTNYPGSDTVKRFLYDLNEFLKNRTTLSSTELQSYINSTSIIKLPELKFDHCSGSDPTKRGYPCALWVLFHSMTIKQAILAEQNQLLSNIKPSDIIVSIREFVGKFFLCEECATHFVNMTADAENEVGSFNETVLYLWRGHNEVNKRLQFDNTSTDPAWPKVLFPTKQQCSLCVQQTDENGNAIEFNNNEVYNYFKEFYYLKNHAVNPKYNYGFFYISFLILCVIIY